MYMVLTRLFWYWIGIPPKLAFAIYHRIVYFVYELPARIAGRGLRLYPGAAQPSGLWCVLATCERRRTSANLIVFLSNLKSAGYNVLLVNNGPIDEPIVTAYGPYCHTIVAKPPGGRDFGSYQWATAHLLAQCRPEEIRQVLYCNDSVFVRPSTIGKMICAIRDCTAPFVGVTEVFEYRYHVQSWCFAVAGSLFISPSFQSFWRRYRPFSDRRYCIGRGECGLSSHLIGQTIFPTVLLTQKMITDICFSLDPETTFRYLTEYLNFPSFYRRFPILAEIGELPITPPLMARMKRAFSDEMFTQNSMNFANLLLLKISDFPFIKKDLIYRDQYYFGQVERAIDHWRGADGEQTAEILGYFRRRGALRWRGLIVRNLGRMGVI